MVGPWTLSSIVLDMRALEASEYDGDSERILIYWGWWGTGKVGRWETVKPANLGE